MKTDTELHDVVGTTVFPSVADVAAALAAVKRTIDAACDVRLQVYEDGAWAVRYGLSDYDQDHRGYWGASSVGPCDEAEQLDWVAADLIDQATDFAAVALAE